LAPPDTTGWDVDPWSRCWTALRHRRWAPWVFEDLTGGLQGLEDLAARALAEPWSGRRRPPGQAAQRLAGLLPSLDPEPAALRAWIAARRPGTILSANVMGQLGVVAEHLLEARFGGPPWNPDPEEADPLAEAVEAWTAKVLAAHLAVLGASGAELWLVYDRAVLFTEAPLRLGGWASPWTRQVQGAEGVEASDPLAGLDVASTLAGTGRTPCRQERWLWPVGPEQQHVVEAQAFRSPGGGPDFPVATVNPCPRAQPQQP